MSIQHDELASSLCNRITNKIRNQENEWKQIFSPKLFRIGDWSWPRPDYICQDQQLGVTYAFEFKPPKQTKREYLTGLGQAIAYLDKHNYSAIVLPKYSDDGFEISDYISKVLKDKMYANLPLSIFEYDGNPSEPEITPVRKIEKLREVKPSESIVIQETFWCWWRDMSQYELFMLLELSDKYRNIKDDIYTNNIWPEFADALFNGKTKDWGNNFRNKRFTKESYKSEKQNYKIPIFQLDLWNQADGKLTFKGYKLLTIGKIFGADSEEFLSYLTKLVLTDGKHLELIRVIDSYQKDDKNKIPEKSKEYLKCLDDYLTTQGMIGKRKPTAIKTDAKGTYLRDEPKLWNKLDLFDENKGRYFAPHEGYSFDWPRILDILTKNFDI